MNINYDLGQGEYKNWIIEENSFCQDTLGKYEVIMALGNGYLGIRSALEENYVGEVRNTFIAGTFNKFHESEVTELPNTADITEINIRINNEKFDLSKGKVRSYSRYLNLKTGELVRNILWENSKGEIFELCFRRFVSLYDLHLVSLKVEITPVNCDANVVIVSGINGQKTNSGTQHFFEGEKRFYDKKIIELIQTTTESDIDFVFNSAHNIFINGTQVNKNNNMKIERRGIFEEIDIKLNKAEKFELEKINLIHTSRDLEFSREDLNYDGKYSTEEFRKATLDKIRIKSLDKIKSYLSLRYGELFDQSKAEWDKKWNKYSITIETQNNFDQLAIRFAQYHLTIMTPAHDSRFGIGAKGLSGEGYKGHSFWDTEIFILPFYTYTEPEIARKLLEYRYHTIEGARNKAKENGYTGAMYPWESAWMNDGEVTPIWGSVDIITGKATKIWSGFIEQHITCDIAFAVWQYFMVTKDEDFMEKYGYEILLDTAKFWSSRLEWNKEKNKYEICNVIGPDEYKEHINNNAFTNYMAKWNIELAIEYYDFLKANRTAIFEKLNCNLQLDVAIKAWHEVVNKIYVPLPDEKTLIVAQDDTYLTKEVIDLSRYKNQKQVGSIFKDYNLEQVNNIQVSKQADIMILFYLLENKFSIDVKMANWNYYEPKTLHDSSLSLSTHCILASDVNNSELAYELFKKASSIDLGTNMNSSDHGIHAASLGGIWQSIVSGFGGVRMLDGKLRINPRLPKEWDKLSFPIIWNNNRINIFINNSKLTINKHSGNKSLIEIEVFGKKYILDKELEINYLELKKN